MPEQTDDLPDYAELSPLLDLFGDRARARVLSVLVGKHYTELKASDVAHLAGIHRSTAYDHLHALEDLGVVGATRPNGGTTVWRLNKNHHVAMAVGRLEHELFRHRHESEAADAG